MTERIRVYWDACAWLGLLNDEPNKNQGLEHVWEMAKRGKVQIWTSAFCHAEVYRVKCEDAWTSIDPLNDNKINNLFDQDFVEVVPLDTEIGKLAKKLLRTHEKLKKPSDAVHLATAIYWDLDQFHTYDDNDFLGLIVQTVAGRDLNICTADKIEGNNLFNYGQDAQ